MTDTHQRINRLNQSGGDDQPQYGLLLTRREPTVQQQIIKRHARPQARQARKASSRQSTDGLQSRGSVSSNAASAMPRRNGLLRSL